MALRTFRSNPSLGGFGGESSAPQLMLRGNSAGVLADHSSSVQDCDAFAQIIKELVDNAVDACCMSSYNSIGGTKKRVRVVLERFEPDDDDGGAGSEKKNRKNEARTEEDGTNADEDSSRNQRQKRTGDDHQGVATNDSGNDDDENEILRVTVSDNGCGMENIQDCVEAFRSSKAGNHHNNSSQQNSQQQQQAMMTAGRYGIGLTLCLLHAQRLVPNSCASITSATPFSTHFTKAQYVVDTEGDSVRCVELTWIPKTHPEESGTSISVLVPGGPTARLAWPRLAEYFARFRLSLGIPCSLEVMANTLSRVPLLVRPPQEEHSQTRQRPRQRQHHDLEEEEKEEEKKEEPQHASWTDVFEDMDDEYEGEDTKNQSPRGTTRRRAFQRPDSVTASSPTDGISNKAAVVSPPDPLPQTTTTKRAKQQAEKEDMRQNMHRAVELYLGHAVELDHVAHSRQPIRVGTTAAGGASGNQRPRRNHTKQQKGPHLEVALVVGGLTSPMEEENDDEEILGDDESHQSSEAGAAVTTDCATMMMVRMVNSIPLLDGAEASSCGLVQGLLQKKKMWNSFGLDVSSSGLYHRGPQNCGNAEAAAVPQLPTFQVRDSDQVAPFFRSNNHSLMEEDPFQEDDEDSDAEDDDGLDAGFASRRKRRRNKRKKLLLPARIRLGNVLVIVKIDAEPSSLPLPTLSKGRLPTDSPAIDKALEVAMLDCLRSLQKTNPALLLTAQQLKKVERDARYVPAVASSIAAIIAKSHNDEFRRAMTNAIISWNNITIGSETSTHNEQDPVDHSMERGVDEEPAEQEGTAEGTGGGDSDEEEDDQRKDAHVNSMPSQQELGENIEARLRKIVAVHDEAPKKRNKARRSTKVARQHNDGDEESVAANNHDEEKSHDSDGLMSFDFSAGSDEEQESRPRGLASSSGNSVYSRRQSLNGLNDVDSDSDASRDRSQRIYADVSEGESRSPRHIAIADNVGFDDDDDWWPE